MLAGLDIVVLAALVPRAPGAWTQASLAQELGISQSQVHYALRRGEKAGLYSAQRTGLRAPAFLEFAEHAIKFFFPPELGAPTRGIYTAHSAPPLAREFVGSDQYVWPYAEGGDVGLAMTPLHKSAPAAAVRNAGVHEVLALVDALRVGRARERARATLLLEERLATHAQAAPGCPRQVTVSTDR